jgi:hypothetical protein
MVFCLQVFRIKFWINSHPSHACYISSPYHPPWFEHCNICWRVKINKFLIVKFFPASCYFLQAPVTSFSLLLLPSVSCYFLQPPVTSFSLLLLPPASCYFLQPPVTSSSLLLLPSVSCYFLQPPVTSSSVVPNILLSTYFSHTLNLGSSLRVRIQFHDPY